MRSSSYLLVPARRSTSRNESLRLKMALRCTGKEMAMAVILSELRTAVIDYLATKVNIEVPAIQPASGTGLSPGETFTFSVTATNASRANGGIGLTAVRYQVEVFLGAGNANIRVPTGGSAIDGSGNPLPVGAEVDFFEFDPSGNDTSNLSPGESDVLVFSGRATGGGAAAIRARILADPDINDILPRNFPSERDSTSFLII
jgi:hypothetical protein